MNDDELTRSIAHLDSHVPPEGAAVRLVVDGDGLALIANREGYLRLGIEFLRAAFLPRYAADESGPARFIHVDLDYLITKDSQTAFSSFELVDGDPRRTAEDDGAAVPKPARSRLVGALVIGLLCLMAVLPCLGLVTLLRWIF